MENKLPESFKEYIKNAFGSDESEKFFSAITETEPVTSIRINPFKKLSVACPCCEVKWSQWGYYLDNRPMFTADPLFHAGCYYVQEASSMFLEQAYRQCLDTDSPVVLDLCAAPGGKSTHLATLMSGNGFLVVNEVVRSRVKILEENMIKNGAPNVMVTNNDPSAFNGLSSVFDLVVIDAPCSGEGMFRKDERAVEEWSEENVKMCAERQRRIVSDVFPALKEDGVLIYSTCTYNEYEDDKNVRWIAENLGAEVLKIEVDDSWGITESDFGYHFYPHKIKGEGFFLSVLKKTEPGQPFKKSKKQSARKESKECDAVKKWIKDSENYVFLSDKFIYSAVSKDYAELVSYLSAELNVHYAGVLLAEQKGKDIIPKHNLAMSWVLSDGCFPVKDLTWEQAISFLKKENILLDNEPKGWILLRYSNIPLGWVKNLGNRSNNLYPQEWRIRMSMDGESYMPILE